MTHEPITVPPPGTAPSRTSKLAVASLILAFIPVLSLLAVIFGIVALASISRSRGALKGKGVAIAGTVVSILSTLSLCIIVPAVGIRFALNAKSGVLSFACKANLTLIGDAITKYKSDNGKMPPDLQTLVTGNYLQVGNAVCPAAVLGGSFNPADVDATGGFYYAPLREDADLKSRAPIVWDRTAVHGPNVINVLFSDGRVESMNSELLEKLITHNAAVYQSPPEVPPLSPATP